MAQLPSETLAKLTENLASDVDLYNGVISHIQQDNEEIKSLIDEREEYKVKLAETETKANNYVLQITNLLARIPVGESKAQQTTEQNIEEIKNRSW